jgi:hypothetical protein
MSTQSRSQRLRGRNALKEGKGWTLGPAGDEKWGMCKAWWASLPTSLQIQKIREADRIAISVGWKGKTQRTKTEEECVDNGSDCEEVVVRTTTRSVNGLDSELNVAMCILIRTLGVEGASMYFRKYLEHGNSHNPFKIVKALAQEALYPTTTVVSTKCVSESITLRDIRKEKEAEEAAIAAAAEEVAARKRARDAFAVVAAEVAVAAVARDERLAAFVPPAMTPHTQVAYNLGLAGECARLSPLREHQKLHESGRKLVLKSHWRHLFVLLAQQVTLIHQQHLEQRIDHHVNGVMDLEERCEKYKQLWQCPMPEDEDDAYVLKWKRARDTDSWATINEMEHSVKASYDRCAAKALMITGVHVLVRKWWKQPKPRAAAIRAAAATATAKAEAAKPKKHVRLTTAEKAIKHTEAIKQLLPAYLVARDIATFTKPVDTISSVRLGNLREARGDAQVRILNKDVRDFVERNGGVIPEGRGGVFIPLDRASRSSKGYCFVNLISPANARLFLDRIAALEHAMLVDSRTGEEREVFPELAASDRKTKEEMKAEKAAAAAKRSADSVDSVSAAIKAVMRGPGIELKPICLADIKREKMSPAEQALKDKIAVAFPSLNSCTSNSASAKHYEVSFAAAAAKPLPEKVEVVNPFEVKVGGVEYALIAAPTTDIGRAQMALKQAAADSIAAEKRRQVRATRVEIVVGENGWEVEKAADASFQETFKARLAEATRKK